MRVVSVVVVGVCKVPRGLSSLVPRLVHLGCCNKHSISPWQWTLAESEAGVSWQTGVTAQNTNTPQLLPFQLAIFTVHAQS